MPGCLPRSRVPPEKTPLPCLLWWAVLFSLGSPAYSDQDFSALDPALGKALFERNWVSAPASTRSASGLGPYYNARACAACHPGGGGSSDPAHFSFLIDDDRYGEALQTRAVPGLAPEARVAVTHAVIRTGRFADGSAVTLSQPVVEIADQAQGALLGGVSARRAPALAGLAALERVERPVLEALADPEDSDGDGISGRLHERDDGTVGRFGWQADMPDLPSQVARALRLDLGLGTTALPAPAGDCSASQSDCLGAAGPADREPEISDQMLDLLLAWLRSLPPPQGESRVEEPGGRLFVALGCEGCHRSELQAGEQVLTPWTDLLLHDLGPGLAAPVNSGSARPGEWRTAPLWGLGRQSRFLHDARAATLEEAILWHDGEAAGSRVNYEQLDAPARTVLHEWLRRL